MQAVPRLRNLLNSRISSAFPASQLTSFHSTTVCDDKRKRKWNFDAKHGTTTGVSAFDRATTIRALASKDSKAEDFNRPGHIFPLKYRDGGVLKRAGHTEASVDLAVLAGFDPVAVLCEIVDEDGSMARLPRPREFAEKENLKIISIADLIRSSNVHPLVIDAHPQESNQFAVGLSDGVVHVFEPLESEGKWGVPPPTENGSSSSLPTTPSVGGSNLDQQQR